VYYIVQLLDIYIDVYWPSFNCMKVGLYHDYGCFVVVSYRRRWKHHVIFIRWSTILQETRNQEFSIRTSPPICCWTMVVISRDTVSRRSAISSTTFYVVERRWVTVCKADGTLVLNRFIQLVQTIIWKLLTLHNWSMLLNDNISISDGHLDHASTVYSSME